MPQVSTPLFFAEVANDSDWDTTTRILKSNGGIKGETVLFHAISDLTFFLVIASLLYRHCERSGQSLLACFGTL